MRRSLKHYNTFAFIFLAAGSVFMIFPFVWMVLSAFKTSADVYSYPPRWIPSTFHYQNFTDVFNKIPFWRYYLNSIFVTVCQTALQIFLSVTAAYALSKLEFPGSKKVFAFLQSSMFIPVVVTMIPLFIIVSKLKLVDTYAGIIFPQIGSAFTTILIYSFFVSIPNELLDAAKIDGCGYYATFARIMLPNANTAISTATLFAFLGHWRSYTWPLIVTNRTELRTLPIGLKYLVQESSSEYQLMMAASLMAIVPILIVYIFTEKQFVRSLTLTGLKS